MKHLNIILILVLWSGLTVTAQNETIKKADKHFARFEFTEAAKAYHKLVERGKGSTHIYTRLAESNYNISNTLEAEKWYLKAIGKETKDARMIFKYAQILKTNGKYDVSNTWMKKFTALQPSDKRAIAFTNQPDYLSNILEKEEKFIIKNLDFNSDMSDFGGTLEKSKLYITSARNNSGRNYGWNDQPFLDIYELEIKDGKYQKANLLNKKINTKYHEGIVSFSPDGNTMYFSRESFFENEYQKDATSNTKYSVINLFKATKTNGRDWAAIKGISFNSNNYSVKNPAVSKDGKTLYFASDMPGGFGLFDIYKTSIRADGSLGKPINMGSEINTPDQEMFPYIDETNTLYFSSNGHLGLGGLDVFFINIEDENLGQVRNIGIPINSNADDFAFTVNDSGEGFVSSNRKGGKGSDDIYAIKNTKPICDIVTTIVVKDAETGTFLSGATITTSDIITNNNISPATNTEGKYQFSMVCDQNANLSISKDGYEDKTLPIKGATDERMNVEVLLDPVKKIIIADRILLDPVYFDFDTANISPGGKLLLDKLVQVMNTHPDMIINTRSHTDTRGSSQYNEELSNRRAKSIVQYVTSKGIEPSRISGVGIGENEPTSNCGNNCSEEEHRLNRRSEFIIVSEGSKKP